MLDKRPAVYTIGNTKKTFSEIVRDRHCTIIGNNIVYTENILHDTPMTSNIKQVLGVPYYITFLEIYVFRAFESK